MGSYSPESQDSGCLHYQTGTSELPRALRHLINLMVISLKQEPHSKWQYLLEMHQLRYVIQTFLIKLKTLGK